MTMHSLKSPALFVAALLGVALLQPFGAAFAATPNEMDNQTAQAPAHSEFGLPDTAYHGGTGVYDRLDQFKTQQGFPRPGDSQLFFPVN